MKEIIGKDAFELEVKEGLVLVDFFAQWCGPCKMVGSVLEELSEEMQGKVKFVKVDVDQNDELAEAYSITNIPSMLILKDGEKQDMSVGFKPKQIIKELLEQYL